MFITAQGGSGFERFMAGIGGYIQTNLAGRGLAVDLYNPDPLSLDARTEVEARMAALAPDGILFIQQTEGSYYNGARSGAVMKAVVLVPGREAPVWRASISTSTSGYAGAGDPAQIARRIVNQMEEDGLLESAD